MKIPHIIRTFAILGLFPSLAYAAPDFLPRGEQVAAAPSLQPAGSAPTVQQDLTDSELQEDSMFKDFSASLGIETSVGLGTMVPDPQTNALVVTSLSPHLSYRLAPQLRLSAGIGLMWYNSLGYTVPLPENELLLSDVSIGLSHSSIYHHDDSKFNLSGSVRVGLPTSLASQFQNRLFSLSTSMTASIPVGPVTFSYTLGLSKYFNLSATPSLNCNDFKNPEECMQGRAANPNFGYESERRGAEIYIPGQGVNSFAVSNSFHVSWAIIDNLSLSLAVSIANAFGSRSIPKDEFSGEYVVGGRSQRDRLMSSLGLDYQVLKHLGLGLSLMTDTTQPFGADGDAAFPVLFDFSRLSDNITSLNFSVTGSL